MPYTRVEQSTRVFRCALHRAIGREDEGATNDDATDELPAAACPSEQADAESGRTRGGKGVHDRASDYAALVLSYDDLVVMRETRWARFDGPATLLRENNHVLRGVGPMAAVPCGDERGIMAATPADLTDTRPTPRESPPIQRTFRPDIEGLRAIAVLLVVLEHAGLSAISGGYIGVDVFFVLSGFLITGLLLKEIGKTGTISIGQFYARRARRLLPAGTLVLVVTVLLSYQVFGVSRANRVAEDAQWAALFASNFRFIQQGTDYLDSALPPSPLQHYWSLAVEEQFYLVWPLLIMLVAMASRRRSLRLTLGVVLTAMIVSSLAWSQYQTANNATAAYFSPFPRVSELAAGALLAVGVPWLVGLPRRIGIVAGWAGIAIIFWTAFTYSPETTFPGMAVMIPVLGTVLAVAGGTIAPAAGAEPILALRPFQWLGKISYSMYLWHWPVLVLAAGWAGHDLSLAHNLLLMLGALALSALTYVLVEDPMRSLDILKRRAPRVSVAFGATMVAIAVGLSSFMMNANAIPEEVIVDDITFEIPSTGAVLQAVADGANVTTWPEQPGRIRNPAYSKECDVTRADTTSSMCVHGDPEASRTMVIFGDSHGAMWIPSFDQVGTIAGWRVVQLTKPGCQVPDYPAYSRQMRREYTECAEYREWAIQQIGQIQPDMLVITSARQGVIPTENGEPTEDEAAIEAAWASGLGLVLDRVVQASERTIVLGDMAYPDGPGLDCLTDNPNNVQACNSPRDEAVFADHNAMEAQVAVEHGAEFVDVIPFFCTDLTCPAVVGGLTTHRDAKHVSENYAVYLSRAIGEATGTIDDAAPSPASSHGTVPARQDGAAIVPEQPAPLTASRHRRHAWGRSHRW